MGRERDMMRKRIVDRPRDAAAPAEVAGKPLDAAVRAPMEWRFGHDFSRVRVHDDANAHATADALGANAYSIGEDISFADGALAPPDGVRTLAHELAHVVQRDRSGAPPDGLLSDASSTSERGAADAAESIAAGGLASVAPAAPAAIALEEDEPSFMRDVVGKTAWDFLNDDTLGGIADATGLKDIAKYFPGIGSGMSGVAGKSGWLLNPLSIISGGMDVYEGATGKRNFENNEKVATGGLNVASGGIGLAGLLGLLPEVGAGTAITGSMGAGAATAAGGQVIGAGLAGYGAGKLMDKATGWFGGATSGDKRSLTDRMTDDSVKVMDDWTEMTGSSTVGQIAGWTSLAGNTLTFPKYMLDQMSKDATTGINNWLFGDDKKDARK